MDGEIAKSAEQTEWEPLGERWWHPGVRAEKGLQAGVRDGRGGLGEALALVDGTSVVEQRCILHTLRQVADQCRGERKGAEKRDERKQLLEQAATRYPAASAAPARARLATWTPTWPEQAPKAVAT